MSSLPQINVPLTFQPTFGFLSRLRIVYFHRLLVRINNGNTSLHRIVAVTSSGNMGYFHVDGARKGELNLMQDIESISFNNRCIFLQITPDSSDQVENDNCTVTLDFDTSSAIVRGNETTDIAIKKFLGICRHFSRGVPITKAGSIEQQKQQMASQNRFEPLVSGNNLYPGDGGGSDEQQNRNSNNNFHNIPNTTSNNTSPGISPTRERNNSSSLRRKAASSTFQKLFPGFSGIWSKDGVSIAGNKRHRGDSGASGIGPTSTVGGDDSDPNIFANYNSNNNKGRGNSGPRMNNTNNNDYEYGDSPLRRGDDGDEENNNEYDTDATVSIDYHGKQRKRMNKWREEILGRLGEREGVDAKERILDDLARLEGSLKKQQALIESPALPTDEEELEQQRALAALVMFICRRQSLLIEANETVLPQVRPKNVFHASANQVVPNSVPVLASYTDAFRSQFLG